MRSNEEKKKYIENKTKAVGDIIVKWSGFGALLGASVGVVMAPFHFRTKPVLDTWLMPDLKTRYRIPYLANVMAGFGYLALTAVGTLKTTEHEIKTSKEKYDWANASDEQLIEEKDKISPINEKPVTEREHLWHSIKEGALIGAAYAVSAGGVVTAITYRNAPPDTPDVLANPHHGERYKAFMYGGLVGLTGTLAGAAYGAIKHYHPHDESRLAEPTPLMKREESTPIGIHTQALADKRNKILERTL